MTDVATASPKEPLQGWKNIAWPASSWQVFAHAMAFVACLYIWQGTFDFGPIRSTFVWQTSVMSVVLGILVLLSITMILHRLYAHRSYGASQLLQYLFLPFFAAGVQGPAMWWPAIHVEHHAYVDTKRDRHSPYYGFGTGIFQWLYGFWWSHMGWLFTKTGTTGPGPRQLVQVLRHPGVRKPIEWETRHHSLLSISVGFVLPTLLGALWGDPLGGLLVGGFLRVVATSHCTWIVNSVAHMIGPKLEGVGSARDAWWWLAPLLALLSVGECNNHGNHHKRPNDWFFGPLDPGGWVLWCFMRIGLAWENEKPVLAR